MVSRVFNIYQKILISHYKEPIDIASTNFSEDTAIFGGKEKFTAAIKNLIQQYDPDIIGMLLPVLVKLSVKMLQHM